MPERGDKQTQDALDDYLPHKRAWDPLPRSRTLLLVGEDLCGLQPTFTQWQRLSFVIHSKATPAGKPFPELYPSSSLTLIELK